jgi:hypothetical protein
VRPLPLLLATLVIAGCGVATNESGAPASSGEESLPAETSKPIPTLDEANLRPPPIVLVSTAGKQEATRGSACVQYADPASGEGAGACSDVAGPLHPERISIVRRGETTLVIVAGASTREGSVTVRPLGCADRQTLGFDLASGTDETRWRVDLEPGAYQLDVFTRFETTDGRSGDVSGSLGILVGDSDARRIVPATAGLAVCPFSD